MTRKVITFSLRRAGRAMLLQGARHALLGVTLAANGLEAMLADEPWRWPDLVGVVSGVLLVGAFVREMRAARAPAHHDRHHGLGWVDIFASAATLVEAWHLHHQGKHLLPWAYVFVAVILFALGVAHPRLRALRRLVLDEDGFDLRLSPWKRVRGQWADGMTLEAQGTRVTLIDGMGGRREIDLGDADKAGELIAAWTDAAVEARAALAPATRVALPGGAPEAASPAPMGAQERPPS